MQSWEETGTTDPEEPRARLGHLVHHWARPIRASLSDDHGCQSHSLDSWGMGRYQDKTTSSSISRSLDPRRDSKETVT